MKFYLFHDIKILSQHIDSRTSWNSHVYSNNVTKIRINDRVNLDVVFFKFMIIIQRSNKIKSRCNIFFSSTLYVSSFFVYYFWYDLSILIKKKLYVVNLAFLIKNDTFWIFNKHYFFVTKMIVQFVFIIFLNNFFFQFQFVTFYN